MYANPSAIKSPRLCSASRIGSDQSDVRGRSVIGAGRHFSRHWRQILHRRDVVTGA